jgi:uncharacterized protein YndB with AHSA1/START domain
MSVAQVSSALNKAIVVGTFNASTPEKLFDYWITSQLLTQWWPPEAEIEPCIYGSYHYFWPQMQWHLRGHFTDFEVGRKLAFTWQWDHYLQTTHVIVDFASLADNGTKLTVTHGDYSESSEDQEARQGHIEGWLYFVGKLQRCIEEQ